MADAVITNEPAPVVAPVPVSIVPVGTIQQQTDETWSGFFRANFSVFVLLFMVVFVFAVALHIFHHSSDAAMSQWIQGHSNTFVGALVGALTAGGAQRLINRPSGDSKQ
jgi:fumarate reductase subunit D